MISLCNASISSNFSLDIIFTAIEHRIKVIGIVDSAQPNEHQLESRPYQVEKSPQ